MIYILVTGKGKRYESASYKTANVATASETDEAADGMTTAMDKAVADTSASTGSGCNDENSSAEKNDGGKPEQKDNSENNK